MQICLPLFEGGHDNENQELNILLVGQCDE